MNPFPPEPSLGKSWGEAVLQGYGSTGVAPGVVRCAGVPGATVPCYRCHSGVLVQGRVCLTHGFCRPAGAVRSQQQDGRHSPPRHGTAVRWHHDYRDRLTSGSDLTPVAPWRHAMASWQWRNDDVMQRHPTEGGDPTAPSLRTFSALPYIAASQSRPPSPIGWADPAGAAIGRSGCQSGAAPCGAPGGHCGWGSRRRRPGPVPPRPTQVRGRPRGACWGGGAGAGAGRALGQTGRSAYPAVRAEPGRPAGRCPGPGALQGRGTAAGPGPSSCGRPPPSPSRRAGPRGRLCPSCCPVLRAVPVCGRSGSAAPAPRPRAQQDRALRVPRPRPARALCSRSDFLAEVIGKMREESSCSLLTLTAKLLAAHACLNFFSLYTSLPWQSSETLSVRLCVIAECYSL